MIQFVFPFFVVHGVCPNAEIQIPYDSEAIELKIWKIESIQQTKQNQKLYGGLFPPLRSNLNDLYLSKYWITTHTHKHAHIRETSFGLFFWSSYHKNGSGFYICKRGSSFKIRIYLVFFCCLMFGSSYMDFSSKVMTEAVPFVLFFCVCIFWIHRVNIRLYDFVSNDLTKTNDVWNDATKMHKLHICNGGYAYRRLR